MYQAKLYVDFDSADVIDRVTREFEEPFDVLEIEVHEDGTISFVVDTRGNREAFERRMGDAPEVSEVRQVGSDRLLVRKEAKGATMVIRENHGKLNGVDRVHGTKRVFEVLLLRRSDLPEIIAGLREMGDVELGSIVEMTGTQGVLSDKQYEAVRTALDIGYFDWPRDGDAERLADELDVSHPTALEHLRKAERKLLERGITELTTRTTHRDEAFLLTPDDDGRT